ncbi:hypothetical protein [Prevotella denticola]|uniref:hypothetical protein n=1 Tax=Prevotella denticola TaxID=28129 RepID=UPI0028F11D14|nr:hypothetical protein [Prevotella denticola]
MEKSRLILVLAMLLASLNIRAGWRVVIDKRTTAAVTANAASQKIIEDKHCGHLNPINVDRQESLLE